MSGYRTMLVCLICTLLVGFPASGPARIVVAAAPVHWQVRAVESLPLQVVGGEANRAQWTRDDTLGVLVNNPVGLVAVPIFLGIRKLVRNAKSRRAEATASPDVEAVSPSLEAIQEDFAVHAADLATDEPPAPINDVVGALATALQQRGVPTGQVPEALLRPRGDNDHGRLPWAVEGDAKRWYRSEQALPLPDDTMPVAAGVLEVGMLRYHLKGGDNLLLEIGIKRIDPASGRVLGRAKAVNTWRRPRGSRDLPDLVEGSEEFALALQDLSAGLVMQCLQQLALPFGAVAPQLPAGTSHSNAAPSTNR